jgi:thiol-disulfide isomerase/thioredoxin
MVHAGAVLCRLSSLALLLLILLLAACGPAVPAPGAASTAPGTPGPRVLPTVTPGPAPSVALASLDGPELTLADWRGKHVVVNFWATWCYPCRVEMPALASVHEGHDDVVVVGVNYLEDAGTARPFVEELDLPFPILLDQRGEMATQLGVVGLPTTYFLDPEGRITGSFIGQLTEERVLELLGKKGQD